MKYLLFVTFFVTCLCSSLVVAENNPEKTKELTSLQKKIKKISQKLNTLKTDKNSLQTELRKLETQYGKSTSQLKELEKQVNDINITLIQNKQQIQSKKKEIDSQKKELERQVKLAYGMGKKEKLKLILSQQDASSTGRMMVYYEYWNKASIKQIARIDEGLQLLRNLEEKHIKESALLETKLEKKKLEQASLLATKAERKQLLVKINKQFSSKKQQMDKYKASEKRLKLLLSSIDQTVSDFPYEKQNNKSFAKLKTKLPWPIKGRITKKFGAKRSDSRWDGVLIKAKEGIDIKAISRGRVVYADWLRGYGLLIIIDHGKGYMTLYAFNQNLYKAVGDKVDAGSIIASVGQSGGRTDAGLYFGIRKKGKPVNPVKWCRKIKGGKVG